MYTPAPVCTCPCEWEPLPGDIHYCAYVTGKSLGGIEVAERFAKKVYSVAVLAKNTTANRENHDGDIIAEVNVDDCATSRYIDDNIITPAPGEI